MPPATASSAPQPSPVRAVLARDLPIVRLRTSVAAGQLIRVGRGIYLGQDSAPGAPPPDPSELRRRAIAHAQGTHRRLTARHVFSHGTAALLWGLPLWRTPERTSVLVAHSAGRGADRRVQRRVGLPPETDVVLIDGLPVTSLGRTLVDCALDLAPIDALVVADAALRAGAQRDEALARLAGRGRRRGIGQAREVVHLADAGAESPGESATRFVVLRDGLPTPVTQAPVATRLGTFWTDVAWPAFRVALEYDGRVKYAGREDLVREKRRHDALVEAGYRVLRVTKEDIHGHALADRVRDAFPPGTDLRLTPRRHLNG
ncbi:hypothetical protein [Cellulomonas alba]|uniref:DUF559 domain-containing protein n=1 Tax=Cellulomonas alba TaxID=3053467 RepID=A0ABT7SFA8_9CELL|nr:hypothetical protein [Cellulomonas alba]MDM7854853.1 hypothetical protein [Cellulomonas alba]